MSSFNLIRSRIIWIKLLQRIYRCIFIIDCSITNLFIGFNKEMIVPKFVIKVDFGCLNNLGWNSNFFFEITKTDFYLNRCILLIGYPITNLIVGFYKEIIILKFVIRADKLHFRFLNYLH